MVRFGDTEVPMTTLPVPEPAPVPVPTFVDEPPRGVAQTAVGIANVVANRFDVVVVPEAKPVRIVLPCGCVYKRSHVSVSGMVRRDDIIPTPSRASLGGWGVFFLPPSRGER